MDINAPFRERGLKLTPQRKVILEVIASSRRSLNPMEVYREAKKLLPRIGLVTVYRTLGLLAEMGLLKRVHLEEGCHGFALATGGHRHYVVCHGCGRAVEFEGCDLSPLFRLVERRTGFRVQDHWLQLFGLCRRCQEEKGD